MPTKPAGSAKKAPAASSAKKPKEVPKALKKLATHRSTAVLLARIKAKAKAKGVAPETLVTPKSKIVEKKIGGENNGQTRKVRVGKRSKSFYPTEDLPKKRVGRHNFKKTVKKFKKGLEPGRVVIVVAGRHRGKRVVVLKTLDSGLLLITGPWALNQCPLRRMHQQYVIVTSTKIDVSGVKLPDNLNDDYFKRKKQGKKKGPDGSLIFKERVKRFEPNKQRKKDQIEVDKQIFAAINKSGQDKFLLRAYLGSYFRLRQGVLPHKLKF